MIGIIEIPATADAWGLFFTTHDPVTGSAAVADSTPTVRMVYTSPMGSNECTNGTEFTWVVEDLSGSYGDGLYRINLDFTVASAPLTPEKVVTAIVDVVFGTVTQRAAVAIFSVGPPIGWGTVVADAGNTASSFKCTHSLSDATNKGKNTLLLPIDGTLEGEGPRKVTDYNAATDFITVSPAFESAPTAGDRFILILR